MRQGKQIILALLLVMTALFATGCGENGIGLTLDPQELYSLPELPAKYTELNSQLMTIQENGAEYAAPTSGSNIQPVQMQDLDGDGREEALAFFRNSADEKPLKICIYEVRDEAYQQTAVIEGSGTAIHSVSYVDLNGDGRMELLVGWRVSADLQVLSVYDLRPGGPEEIMRTNYMRYSVLNLNEDPRMELVVLRVNEMGIGVADYYAWKDKKLALRSTAPVSMTMAELAQQGRVTGGKLQNNVSALFVTGVEVGAEQNTGVVYDILTVKNGELVNAVLSPITGVSSEITRFSTLYPTDINGDGVTEVPWPLETDADAGSAQGHCFIDWRSYDSLGRSRSALATYHDTAGGWYLQLPDSWKNRIRATSTSQLDETSVTFSIRGKKQEADKPFLRITTITGSNRMLKAVRGNQFNLSRQADTVYVAELLEANAKWPFGVTEDQVRAAFNLIKPEWSSGEN